MDPYSSTPPTPAVADPPTSVPALSLPADAPASSTSENYPSYDQMICTAIATLDKGKGSTKNAIGNFMKRTYVGLPLNHNELLIERLNVLTSDDRLIMVKKSYELRNSDASSSPSPAKRGRPRKRKLDELPPDVPLNDNPPKRCRRPLKIPKNITPVPVPFALPPDSAVRGASPQVVGAGSSGGVRTPQDSAVSAAGRPKKVTPVEEELRRKLEHVKSKVNQYIPQIKRHFHIDSELEAIIAIKELEALGRMDLDRPLRTK
ncbi:hypothetical protein QN277_006290 [Acacia crassicarpa]|uniref:H15 domain-containing protein n=1 Tax=Acacia crassicarpa TaxID=499986 RepID=A0AAE1M8I4_9FABA|nr:hypothetical protein QN277_006290 [Acacia crassicarpa]